MIVSENKVSLHNILFDFSIKNKKFWIMAYPLDNIKYNVIIYFYDTDSQYREIMRKERSLLPPEEAMNKVKLYLLFS